MFGNIFSGPFSIIDCHLKSTRDNENAEFCKKGTNFQSFGKFIKTKIRVCFSFRTIILMNADFNGNCLFERTYLV